MLQKLNERFQGIFAWVIIGIVAVTFTLFGIEYYIQSKQTSDHVLLKVNGSPITKEMLRLRVERARRLSDASELTQKNEDDFLHELVHHEIAVQSARQDGFRVMPSEVQSTLLKLPQFSEEGRFSPQRYQQILASALYSNDEFQRELQEQMLIQQEQFSFLATEFTLPNELVRYAKNAYETRRYRYLEIPTDRFIKTVLVTEKEVNAYYEKHREEFTSPEAVSLSYVQLSLSDVKSRLTLTDEELQQYYRENQMNFSEKGQIKSFNEVKSELRTELIADKAQLEYARLLEILSDLSYQNPNELESSADALGLKVEHTQLFTKEGGNSPLTQNPHVIQVAFSDAVLASKENSAPVQLNPETVVVFRVLEHAPVKALPFDAVKGKINTLLIHQKSIDAASDMGNKLLTAEKEKRLELIKQYSLNWHSSASGTPEKESSDVIRQLAARVKTAGDVAGEILMLSNGKKAYVFVEVESILPGKLKQLNAEQRRAMTEQLTWFQGQKAYGAYLAHKKTTSPIKVSA